MWITHAKAVVDELLAVEDVMTRGNERVCQVLGAVMARSYRQLSWVHAIITSLSAFLLVEVDRHTARAAAAPVQHLLRPF